MTWPVRMVPAPTFEVGADGLNGFQRLRAGDAWYAEPRDADHLADLVAPQHLGKRPVIVRLPGPFDFAVYGPTWKGGKKGAGWQVSGDPPALTVVPSINIEGTYHGYIQNGVILQDVEGRKFDADGKRL